MKHKKSVAIAAALFATLGLTGAAGAATIPLASATLSTANSSTSPSTLYQQYLIQVQKTGSTYNQYGGNNQGYNHKSRPGAKRRHHKRRENRHGHSKRRHNNYGYSYAYPYYYGDNYYYGDRYYDPYSYGSSYGRYSCGEIRNVLRRHGYRHIEAHDCTGKVYTFVAYSGRRLYKLRVRSSNASIKSRSRL